MARRPTKRGLRFVTVLLCATAFACASPPPADEGADDLTVGTVQREITIGMDAASVAEILGSPNIVTTDDQRREVWIYDKISTESMSASSSTYGTLVILGGSTGRSSSSKTQKTLTVIIKFDEAKKVRDFAYNYSQF